MKTFFAIMFFALTATASNVRFVWDPSPDAGCSYRLYAHTNALDTTNLTSAAIKVNVGTNLTGLVEGLTSPGQWYFVVTALWDNLESDPSNQVVLQLPLVPKNRITRVNFGNVKF